jgi:PEGA domain
MSRVVAVMACGFTLAACSASMPSLEFLKSSSSETEAVRVESQPSGAEAKAASGQSCRTPCELNVAGGGETITLALNGYQPQTVSLQPEASGTLASITGSTRLGPNPVKVELQPAPAPSPKKKSAAKKKTTVTAARPAASSVASAAPPAAPPAAAAPAPEAPAEAAASATNYPWPSR